MMMVSPCAAFWLGKRVLMTGHTGFKGSWLSLWLQSMGAEVCGFAQDPSTKPSLFDAAGVAKGLRSEIGDVRDYNHVLSVAKAFQPEIVFHLAAQPLVRQSYIDPIETYSTNLMGTVNLLEAVKNVGSVKAVVNVTSDKCYENREWVWGYREDEPMGGFDPYSNSKGCSELITNSYRQSFYSDLGIGLATARAGNVIGGGDWSQDRLVPDLLAAFEQKNPIIMRNPQAIRPWQHVLEPLSGYLILAENLFSDGDKFSGAWNFGPHDQDAKSVHSIVERLATTWGEGANWQIDTSPQPHEANYLKLDISKAMNYLHWRPRWEVGFAIEKIVDWHKAWLDKSDMRIKCLSQIDEFLNHTNGNGTLN